MLMLPLIADFWKHCCPSKHSEWNVRLVHGCTGINYGDVYMLEKLRIITPVRRNELGRLIWSPEELDVFLGQIVRFLEAREQGMTWWEYALNKNGCEVAKC